MGSKKGRTMVEVGADGVAVITIINPPVNSLSLDVLQSLKESFDEALQRDDVKAIVVAGANGKFSGGFDISAFGGIQQGADATGMVRKTGCNLKEKLREYGGLDVVFEVALECHSVLEGWLEQSSSSPLIEDKKDVQSLVLLLNCLKIMENAAFLSSDNQH